jgi:small-conductance mechanosensitive channel
VLGTLSALVGCLLHVCAFFLYLYIFGVNVSQLVISLSSMTLAFAFVFGNSLRTLYESVVFLFVARPYKVGDWIVYEGKEHRVASFGLLWTQLVNFNGVRVAVRPLVLLFCVCSKSKHHRVWQLLAYGL